MDIDMDATIEAQKHLRNLEKRVAYEMQLIDENIKSGRDKRKAVKALRKYETAKRKALLTSYGIPDAAH